MKDTKDTILELEQVTYTYGEGTPFCHSALHDVSFTMQRGEFLGIIGHTGSGKSTLIQHFNGLLRPTKGRVLLDGEDIWAEPKKVRSVRFRVGLVFQYPEYQLFEETVFKDIAFGPLNMGCQEIEIKRRVSAALHFSGLPESFLEKSPFSLSGGQKRRVAIAGVIAMEPELLVLDEPTAGLDPQGREELLSHLRAYHRETGATVVLVSHSMEDIARYTERIIVLREGALFLDGTPREIFSHGEELTTAGLDVPQATRMAMALRDCGIPVDCSLYTVEELAEALLRMKE